MGEYDRAMKLLVTGDPKALQVRATDDIELLQNAIIHISLAQDSTDVEIVLLDLDKE